MAEAEANAVRRIRKLEATSAYRAGNADIKPQRSKQSRNRSSSGLKDSTKLPLLSKGAPRLKSWLRTKSKNKSKQRNGKSSRNSSHSKERSYVPNAKNAARRRSDSLISPLLVFVRTNYDVNEFNHTQNSCHKARAEWRPVWHESRGRFGRPQESRRAHRQARHDASGGPTPHLAVFRGVGGSIFIFEGRACRWRTFCVLCSV